MTEEEKAAFDRVREALEIETTDTLGTFDYKDRTALEGRSSWCSASATWGDIETLVRLISRLAPDVGEGKITNIRLQSDGQIFVTRDSPSPPPVV